ncbi:MAG: acyl-ACP--UDP-N-acetylglucosamine O-acyltransferase [Sedimentisphaerales bacterium]|nr:acyl-ACP--UDP-N-acetylglucosamine O-acyltransferase [Sedimentisphaerales bacterium]
MKQIHPTAIIDKSAELGDGVKVGPHCVIGSNVTIGDDCELRTGVVIESGVSLGRNNRLSAGVVLGEEAQILNEFNPEGLVIIGDDNIFRENVTINRGSKRDTGRTVVGNHAMFMIGSHVGHDAVVEDHVLLGNYVQIGGHCCVEHHAIVSAMSGTHQFVTIGCYVFTGGCTGMQRDVPPYMRVSGMYNLEVHGVNVVGLQRNGFGDDDIEQLHQAWRRLWRRRNGEVFADVLAELDATDNLAEPVCYLVNFVKQSNMHRFGRYRQYIHAHA